MSVFIFVFFMILSSNFHAGQFETPEERHGVTFASKCEVCKVLADELEDQLTKTGKSSDVLEIGFNIDDQTKIKKIPYKKSEVRLMEVMDSACENILQYNIHKERKDSTRFAKGMSQTFQTLHGLVNKGVKVELGIPYDLWDKPSAEVEHLKKQCDIMLEENEEIVNDWYFEHSDERLKDFLCSKVLKNAQEKKCLHEKPPVDNKSETEQIPKTEL